MDGRTAEDRTGPEPSLYTEMDHRQLIESAFCCIMKLNAQERKEILSKYAEV